LATQYGVDSLHVVCHSKGGLDAKSYLERFHPANSAQFKVLSLTTIGTPHAGSVLADMCVERNAQITQGGTVEFQGFPWFTGVRPNR